MILEILDKLVDRGIQLVKARQETRARFFTNRIDPIQSALDQVHGTYLATYLSYIARLDGTQESLLKVMQQVRRDWLFSHHVKAKVYRLARKLLPPEYDWKEDVEADGAEGYARKVLQYLCAPLFFDPNFYADQRKKFLRAFGMGADYEMQSQLYHMSAYDRLARLAATKHPEKAEAELTDLVREMQERFADITRNYADLRQNYLRD